MNRHFLIPVSLFLTFCLFISTLLSATTVFYDPVKFPLHHHISQHHPGVLGLRSCPISPGQGRCSAHVLRR